MKKSELLARIEALEKQVQQLEAARVAWPVPNVQPVQPVRYIPTPTWVPTQWPTTTDRVLPMPGVFECSTPSDSTPWCRN